MKNVDEPIFTNREDPSQLIPTKTADLGQRIKQLVAAQSFCVLCTQGQEQPYGSLVAYAHSEDAKKYFFCTSVNTRKFKLLSNCDRIAMVIDSRCDHQTDMKQVEAVTITGKAKLLKSGDEYREGIQLLNVRHPYLTDFLTAQSTALFRIDVVRYLHVTHFQEVSQWKP